jgi:beta-lactamase class A
VPVVAAFWRQLGFDNMHIQYLEKEIGDEPSRRYQNTSTPLSMCKVLKSLQKREVLNGKSTEHLLNYMLNDSTTHKRILGQLPKNIRVAHKTGTGMNICNDVGILYFPNGKQIALSVFVMHADISYESSEHLIAVLSRETAKFFE